MSKAPGPSKGALNLVALLTTLALGGVSWALTREATDYLIVNLIGAIVLWIVLAFLVLAIGGMLTRAMGNV